MAEAVPGGIRDNGATPYVPPINPPQPGGLAPEYQAPKPRVPDLSIHGRRGLRAFSGYVFEEWLPELQGERGRRTYKEIRDSNPVVGGVLFAFEMLIRQVDWRIEKADDSPEADADALFIEQCHGDMEEAWPDTLSEILTFLPYGWSMFETLYKLRGGPEQDDPAYRSQYDDGKIGWRRFAIRAQDSLLRWEIDPDSDEILGMWQMPPPTYQMRFVPMAKSLLFRTSVLHGSPEGRSLLRNVYTPDYFLKHIMRIEAIGVERDLAGFPVLKAPGELLDPNASAEDKARFETLKTLVRDIKRDEQEGMILPSDVDPETHLPLYELTLLSTGGRRQFATGDIIARYKTECAMAMLADFIMLGHETSGTYALGESKRGLFVTAIGAFLDMIAGVINRFAIPELMRLNGRTMSHTPNLVHGDIDPVDLEKLAAYVLALAQAGVLPSSPELQTYLMEVANMPAPQPAPLVSPSGPGERYPPSVEPPDYAGSPEEVVPSNDDSGEDDGDGDE